MKFLHVLLISDVVVGLKSCIYEEKHREKPQSQNDLKTKQSENTAICGADWEGDRGDLVFPGLVTLDECEVLCEPIYEELIESNGTGFCQFGAE